VVEPTPINASPVDALWAPTRPRALVAPLVGQRTTIAPPVDAPVDRTKAVEHARQRQTMRALNAPARRAATNLVARAVEVQTTNARRAHVRLAHIKTQRPAVAVELTIGIARHADALPDIFRVVAVAHKHRTTCARNAAAQPVTTKLDLAQEQATTNACRVAA